MPWVSLFTVDGKLQTLTLHFRPQLDLSQQSVESRTAQEYCDDALVSVWKTKSNWEDRSGPLQSTR